MADEQRCATCRFFELSESGPEDVIPVDFGPCHRHAPHPVPGLMEKNERFLELVYNVVWPETWSEDYCGEWQAKPDEGK